MTESKKLEVGDKYLNVQVLGKLQVPCFKNPNKKPDNRQPDYVGEWYLCLD